MQIAIYRRSFLFAQVEQGCQSRNSLELIIGTEQSSQKQLASYLAASGAVEHISIYDSIPYLGLRCDAIYARGMLAYAQDSGRRPDWVGQLKSIEAAARFAIIPSKPSLKQGMWNLKMIGAMECQSLLKSRKATIAIIDTGVDYNHEQLSKSFGSLKGYDFVNNSPNPMDENGHGTHVAGTAFGTDTGVAPLISAYALRVLDEKGSGSELGVMSAIEWAVANNVDVASMSLGSPYASIAFRRLCSGAAAKGLLLVAAAGNDGNTTPNYPAAFDGVISVAAVDENKQRSYFSNIGSTNDIAAPGEGILSCWPGNGYEVLSGTSMATPHVSGCLALAKANSSFPLEALMKETAEKLEGRQQYPVEWLYGAGLLRADMLARKINYEERLKKILTSHPKA